MPQTKQKESGNRQNLFVLKVNALVRHVMIRHLANYFPLYIVTEHPKSGGTWVSQMIAEYLGVPFVRNAVPTWGAQVMHCHNIGLSKQRNVFVVFRDGRDVMVSYYYHSLFYNNLYNARHVDRVMKGISFMDLENIHTNLPKFIEFLYDDRNYPRLTWSKFVNDWMGRGAVIVRYERLLQDCAGELGTALEKVTGEKVDYERLKVISGKYSFENQAKRRAGEASNTNWLRKGIAGDWKSGFSRKSREIFAHYAGEALIKAGYEKDYSWVQEGA